MKNFDTASVEKPLESEKIDEENKPKNVNDKKEAFENVRNEEEVTFHEPNDELCEKITTQVELYFSDINIVNNKFLLKHVKKSKEGFVSLKLVSGFRSVKKLTKDWREVAFAVKKCSKKLAVNEDCTRVRRVDELPNSTKMIPFYAVLAFQLPMEFPTIDDVKEVFSTCGNVVFIRILRQGNPVSEDFKHVLKHTDIGTKTTAIVQFENEESVKKATDKFNEEDEDKIKVIQLNKASKTKMDKSRKAFMKNQKNIVKATSKRFSKKSEIDKAEAILAERIDNRNDDNSFGKNSSLNPDAPAFQMPLRHQRPTSG